MTDWKIVHGTQHKQPDALDLTSSPSTVYERRNFKQSEPDEDGVITREYEEREWDVDEFMKHQSAKISSLETELEQTRINQEQNNSDILTIMEMVLEMYLQTEGI